MATKIKDLRFFDSGLNSSLDRITIVLMNTKVTKSSGVYYDCIGSCWTGISVFTHCDCQLGEHLGKELQFSELSTELQNRIKEYCGVKPWNLINVIPPVNGKYGAPMGRPNIGDKPKDGVKVYTKRINLVDGGYDAGGAYWGIGPQLTVSFTADLKYVEFKRD